MKTTILGYVFSLIVMLVMDAVWLGTMAPRFYIPKMGALMAATPNWIAAGLFYLIYAGGISLLVVWPALRSETSLLVVFGFGAALGFVAYATYDLTNQATIQNWPVAITLVDLVWGTLLTGVVSTCAVYLVRLMLAR